MQGKSIDNYNLALSDYFSYMYIFSFDHIMHLSSVILSNKGNITRRAKEKVLTRGKNS